LEYSGVLKTRKLLILRDAKNAEDGEIAPIWNVSGTRVFHLSTPLANFPERKKRSGAPGRTRICGILSRSRLRTFIRTCRSEREAEQTLRRDHGSCLLKVEDLLREHRPIYSTAPSSVDLSHGWRTSDLSQCPFHHWRSPFRHIYLPVSPNRFHN
jgi:hypothetical protein